MGKPRVILADLDEKYLAPLEMKFLEELGDTIDLEMITDESFFERYFTQSRSADVLVVSEELYNCELQKQNISNIFVLTEQHDEGNTDDLAITRIFKYTNPKEIYNQVLSASSGTIKAETHKTKETIIVLVYSPSGGVGKTTLALGMCSCFAQSYKRVLYVNAERINTFQHWLNNKAAIPNNMYAEITAGGNDLFNRMRHIVRTEKFDYIPPFGASLSSLNINYSIYEEIVKSAKLTKEYDVIVVDTDSVFDAGKASLITEANKVVLVVDQSKSSVFSMNMLMKNMSCNDNEKYHFVCNRFDTNKSNALVSSDEKPKFIVNEYIGFIEDIDATTASDLSSKADIQKTSFLII